MDKKLFKGKVQTVLGLIDSDKLGFTITHEHILSDARGLLPGILANSKVGRDLNKTDVESSLREVILYKDAGGGAIVDVTPLPNPGRNPQGLARIAKESGVNLVMGISYYYERSYTPDMEMDYKKVKDIARQYIDEITNGVGDTGIKPGVIGEAGCSWPLTPNERKCLQAAALAQQETGLPISIHPGFNVNAPMEIVDILTAAGVKPDRIILGHMECSCPPKAGDMRLRLADRGCYLQFDSFGAPRRSFPLWMKIPSDEGRVDQIAELVNHGLQNQILVSHDLLTVKLMAVNGGPGIVRIPKVIVPLMKKKGLSDEQIQAITVDNPARAFSIT